MEWISVKDRLPEERNVEVIIYFKNIAGWQRTACIWDGDYFIDECDECEYREAYLHDTPVTHWMPLPKPPTK